MSRSYDVSQEIKAAKNRTLFTLALIIVAVPLTLLLWKILVKFNHYIIFSFILLCYTITPFFLVFEQRKPKARELVMISTMSSITVFANLISSFTIPVHAGTALVIISGISLGPEAGFFVGALSRFICNFFTGQGPWTPWEMLAWGIIGFIAGIAFNIVDLDQMKSNSFKSIMGPIISIIVSVILAYIIYLFNGKPGETFWGWRVYLFGLIGLIVGMLLQRRKLKVDTVTVTLFTFFSVFIIYGGLMNIAALIMANAINPDNMKINFESLKLLYITGFSYDAIHAIGASICIILFGDQILRKLERIKIKYGIISAL